MRLVSEEFLYFFLAVFTLHWLLPGRWRNALLVLASYFFYAWWNWRYTGLLFGMTCASYLLGRAVHKSRGRPERHAWVLAAIVLHVGVLAYFKCGNFGTESLEASRGTAMAQWAIPLGLSYYTFQCLGYVLDVARGLPAAERFLPYCLFVSFFAQLTAGPIGRARSLLPQIEAPRHWDWSRFYEGCHLIYWGLFQKVFIADSLRSIVVFVFDGPVPESGLETLLGIYAFTLQLYGDFAGYSNIARGLGKCLSLDLAENFRLPFLAQDMQEHWKRWHLSLSEWFADFVYRPLVDLPVGYYKFFAAPFVTMLIMGLWHRPNLQMAALGLNYGFWLALTFAVKIWALRRGFAPTEAASAVLPWVNRALTFHLVCGGFILLRAHSLGHAASLAARVFGPFHLTAQAGDMSRRLLFFAGPLIALELLEHVRGGAGSLYRLPLPLRGAIYAGMLFLLVAFVSLRSTRFYYSAF